MIKKGLLLIIIFFLNFNCGFTPIYSGSADFQIAKLELKGDNAFNNFLNLSLKKYSNITKSTKYEITAFSDYEKKIISKNSSGSPTEYELIIIVTFEIENNDGLVAKKIFEEKIKMESLDSKFEEKNFERLQKQNFATIISTKLISELSNIR